MYPWRYNNNKEIRLFWSENHFLFWTFQVHYYTHHQLLYYKFYYIIAYYNSKIRQNVKNVNCCVQANKYTGTLVWLPFNSGFWCLMRILSFNCSNLKLFSCPIISKSPRFTLLKPQLWDLTCCNGGNTCMPFKLFPVRPEMCVFSSNLFSQNLLVQPM